MSNERDTGSGRLRGACELALINSPGNTNPYHLLVYLLFLSLFMARNFKDDWPYLSPLLPAP